MHGVLVILPNHRPSGTFVMLRHQGSSAEGMFSGVWQGRSLHPGKRNGSLLPQLFVICSSLVAFQYIRHTPRLDCLCLKVPGETGCQIWCGVASKQRAESHPGCRCREGCQPRRQPSASEVVCILPKREAAKGNAKRLPF